MKRGFLCPETDSPFGKNAHWNHARRNSKRTIAVSVALLSNFNGKKIVSIFCRRLPNQQFSKFLSGAQHVCFDNPSSKSAPTRQSLKLASGLLLPVAPPLSWWIESFPLSSLANHTQPDPNTPTPAALNSSLNLSNEPN